MKFLTITALAASLAMPAWAQPNCLPREAMLKGLAEGFNETRRIIGMTRNGLVMELFASKDGTWTAVVSNAEGISCIASDGDGFEMLDEELPAKGDDL